MSRAGSLEHRCPRINLIQDEPDDVLDGGRVFTQPQRHLHALQGDNQIAGARTQIPPPFDLPLFAGVSEKGVEGIFESAKEPVSESGLSL